jgi:hypothetical protein
LREPKTSNPSFGCMSWLRFSVEAPLVTLMGYTSSSR